MQKSAAGDAIEQQTVGAVPRRPEDGADVADRLACLLPPVRPVGVRCSEGGEVVGAGEGCGSPLHWIKTQRPAAIPDESRDVRGTDALVRFAGPASLEDAVLVRLVANASARVEVSGRVHQADDADGGGQPAVERTMQSICRDVRLECQGNALRRRVNAGVRPARPLRQDRFAGHFVDCRGKRALDRRQARLHLPAEEVRAVVGNGKAEGAASRRGRRSSAVAVSLGMFSVRREHRGYLNRTMQHASRCPGAGCYTLTSGESALAGLMGYGRLP